MLWFFSHWVVWTFGCSLSFKTSLENIWVIFLHLHWITVRSTCCFFGYSWELQLLLVSSAQCAIGLLWDNGRGRRPRQVFNTISSQPSGSLQTCDEYWEAAGDYIVFWLERRVMIRFTVDQLHKPEAVEKQKKYYHPPLEYSNHLHGG